MSRQLGKIGLTEELHAHKRGGVDRGGRRQRAGLLHAPESVLHVFDVVDRVRAKRAQRFGSIDAVSRRVDGFVGRRIKGRQGQRAFDRGRLRLFVDARVAQIGAFPVVDAVGIVARFR